MAWVAFVILYLGLLKGFFPGLFASNIGGGVDAIKASQYVSIHFVDV